MGQAKMKHPGNEGYIDASKLYQDAGYVMPVKKLTPSWNPTLASMTWQQHT
jgi:hypothetical protein